VLADFYTLETPPGSASTFASRRDRRADTSLVADGWRAILERTPHGIPFLTVAFCYRPALEVGLGVAVMRWNCRGAAQRVVVNDLRGTTDGSGISGAAALCRTNLAPWVGGPVARAM